MKSSLNAHIRILNEFARRATMQIETKPTDDFLARRASISIETKQNDNILPVGQ